MANRFIDRESAIITVTVAAIAMALAWLCLDVVVNALYDVLDNAGFFKWLFNFMGWN